MVEIPLPSFETLGKISGWVAQQANTWLEVLKSPKDFVSNIDLTSQAEFGKSVQFLFFVIVCCIIVEIPVDALRFHLSVFDATTQICNIILLAIDIVLFSSAIFFFGRAVLGKGRYRATLIAMFYSAAFYPILTLPSYLASWNSEDLTSGSVKNVLFILGSLAIYIYISVKLIPVIKYVHSIGAVRAFLVFWFTAFVVGCYELLIEAPFIAEMVKQAGK